MFIYSILANHLFINLILPFSPYHHSIHPMSSIKHPIFKGQKTVFFHCFLTLFSSSNHYMLWSTPIIFPLNHNTSSELYSQRDSSPGTCPPAAPQPPYIHFPINNSDPWPVSLDHKTHILLSLDPLQQ